MTALTGADRGILLTLAHRAVTDRVAGRETPLPQEGSAALRVLGAAFVTLARSDGTLRGCRGEVRACRPLVVSVRTMAVASASDDPRFSPVGADEVEDLRIGISVLSPLTAIQARDIEVGRHGLYLVRGRRGGLLLPEVPVAQGWDVGRFLRAVCEKAGLPGSALEHPETVLYGFETEAWGDDDPRGE